MKRSFRLSAGLALISLSLLLVGQDCTEDQPPKTPPNPLALDCVIAGNDVYIPLEPVATPDWPYFTAGTGQYVEASLTARLPADLFCALSDAGYTQVDLGSATVTMSITFVTQPVPPEVVLQAIGLPMPAIDTALACGGALGAEIPLEFPVVLSVPWSDGGWTVDYLVTVGGIDFGLTNLAPSGPDLSLIDLCQPTDRSVPANGTTDDPEDSPRIAADRDGDGSYEAVATTQGQIQFNVNGWCAGYKCNDFNDCTIDTCYAGAQWCTWDLEPDGTPCAAGSGTCQSGTCATSAFPCTEQGILDAIAASGGPHTFACSGPTTVNTTAEILIDNDVVLDGSGVLTVDAGGTHRVFSVPPGVTVELRGMTITGGAPCATPCNTNPLVDVGGGIRTEGTLTVRNTIVTGNFAAHGGGIMSGNVAGPSPGLLTIVDSTLSFNEADSAIGGSGSAIAAPNGDVSIIRSTIADNPGFWATAFGATAGTLPVTVTITDTTLDGGSGGSVYGVGAAQVPAFGPLELVIENSLIQGFTGGLYFGGEVTVLVENATFAQNGFALYFNETVTYAPGATLATFNNVTLTDGGIITGFANEDAGLNDTVIIRNSIANGICSFDFSSNFSLTTGGNNIEVDGDTCGFTDPTDQVNVTPAALNLGPLQDNGGPTQSHLPGGGSVAIDQVPLAECVDASGLPLTADQRGVARPQSTDCDVGAVEAEAVDARSWGTPELLETNVGHAEFPQVVVDPSGDAVAVWDTSDGSASSIYANRLVSGVWGTEQLLETGTGSADFPQVAVDPNGNAVVVWRQDDGGVDSIYANRLVSGAWGTPQLLETDNTGHARGQHVAVDANGDAVAVWYQDGGGVDSIYANRLVSGVWGTPQLLEAGAGSARGQRVAVDPNGDAVVVWHQDDGGVDSIYANRLVSGVWGTPQLLEAGAGSARFPKVAVDPNGDAVVVWHQDDGGVDSIYANRLVSGVWGTAQLLETDPGDAGWPQVAVAANGDAVVVWWQEDGGVDSIYANRLASGVWGTPQLLETDPGYAWESRVAVDPNGDAVVVWSQSGGSVYSIYANRLVSGVWGTPQLLETDNTGDAYTPVVAVDPNGDAVAVWYQWDGSTFSIYANRFQ